MITYKITVLPGDGIGPEVIAEAVKVMHAVGEQFGVRFDTIEALVGAVAIDSCGDPFPKDTETLCKGADAILFGAIGDPKYDNDPSAKVRPEQGLLRMRKTLGLYANIRPVKTYAALQKNSPIKEEIISGTDFVVFRELTGGIYFGQPSQIHEDGQSAIDSCTYTIEEITRIAKRAFAAAQNRNKKLTLVDKANVLATSQLWRKVVQNMSSDYPNVTVETMFVDNAAMQLILNPSQFDVILTENMFGDIITDEASVITGSIGLMPSASIGDSVGLYEPIHGSYPQAAGLNKANPMATILSMAMMLEHSFNMKEASEAVHKAVENTLESGKVTEDINPENPLTTEEVGSAIAESITSTTLA
jgi:3-isopropylmalate dehydrogenase